MSRFSYYGSGQRLAFGMMCVGFGLCILGAVVPFWMKSEVKMSDVTLGLEKVVPDFGEFLNKLMNKVELVKVNLGVWVFCLELVGSETKCYSMYSNDEVTDKNGDFEDNPSAWIYFVRIAIAINIKLSVICGLAACCRCLCCSGGRTVCHGIFAFIAGGCGIAAFAIMTAHKDDLVSGVLFMKMELDWAAYVYVAGSGLMILASLFLCFALPKEMPQGTVYLQGPSQFVTVANPTQAVGAPVSQYELNGQIHSFEPLPDHTVFQNPAPPQY